jgi:hypothetical protein
VLVGLALLGSGRGQESPATDGAATAPPRSALAEPPAATDGGPGFLDRPLESPPAEAARIEEPVDNPFLPPLGFTGPSGILPRESRDGDDFIPVEDRWRAGFPEWDRYGLGHPNGLDYPYMEGHWWDPYNQNVLKGDYPIIGQHTFLNLTATEFGILELRQLPTPTTPFESTARPFEDEFFGRPNQFLYLNYLSLSVDLFHGDTLAFKPVDWRIKLTPIFNVSNLNVQELAIVNPDVREGLNRARTFTALQEWFVESKLMDLGPDYDFLSIRIGSQPFNSDFRGFIFFDTNRGVRLFGTRLANRDQFNVVFFSMQEKDTNSQLNTFDYRHQDVLIANYYRQDFIWPGYTTQVSLHYNHDKPSFEFDRNKFLVRPDAAGVFTPHNVNAWYLGWTGDGHINRFNVNHAFYCVFGRDSLNPIANQPQDIFAQMAALEVSYDRDWARFRTSLFWASGDDDPNNSHATGFDTILDNPNFAGGAFSYWQRQNLPLFGVNLVQRESLVPDLRSSKIQGQSNFVNPGLFLLNFGVDFDLTPKLRMINNANVLWFDQTAPLKTFLFQDKVRNFIGTDLSAGFEYRPCLNNNIIAVLGVAAFLPGDGFRDLYNRLNHVVPPLGQAFLELTLQY